MDLTKAQTQRISETFRSYYIGQDSEFFLWNTEKERVVPAHKYFEVKKKALPFFVRNNIASPNALAANTPAGYRPTLLPYLPAGTLEGSLAFRDGMAVEINTRPVSCRGHFFNDVRRTLLAAFGSLPEEDQKKLAFTTRPWVRITPGMFKNAPEDVKELGCNPTFSAYRAEEQRPPAGAEFLPHRTSGAHFHMSFTSGKPEGEFHATFIKVADLLMGVPFTYVFGDNLEFRRRKLYGKAGEYRVQKYSPTNIGLEYRVLSSRVWNHTGVLNLFAGIWKYLLGYPEYFISVLKAWDPAWEDDLQEAINLGTPKVLKKMLALSVKHIPNPRYPSEYTPEQKAYYDQGNELRGLLGATVPEDSRLAVWQKLRVMNEKGYFKDAGLLDPNMFEGHTGWQALHAQVQGYSDAKA